MHALLHGADLLKSPHSKRSLGHQHVLAPSERSLSGAIPIIRQLLMRAAQRLRSEHIYCRRLTLEFKWLNPYGYHLRDLRFQETQDTDFLLKVLMSLWQHAWKQTPHPKSSRVSIFMSGFVPAQNHQADLFDKPKLPKLMGALDTLNEIFGRGTISYGTSVPEMVSKIAFQRFPDLKEF